MAAPVTIIPALHGEAAKMFLDWAEALEYRSDELRVGKNQRSALIYNEREEQTLPIFCKVFDIKMKSRMAGIW